MPDPTELSKGIFGYRKSVVNQLIADRDIMLRQAEGRVRAAESKVAELENEMGSLRERNLRMDEQLERLRAQLDAVLKRTDVLPFPQVGQPVGEEAVSPSTFGAPAEAPAPPAEEAPSEAPSLEAPEPEVPGEEEGEAILEGEDFSLGAEEPAEMGFESLPPEPDSEAYDWGVAEEPSVTEGPGPEEAERVESWKSAEADQEAAPPPEAAETPVPEPESPELWAVAPEVEAGEGPEEPYTWEPAPEPPRIRPAEASADSSGSRRPGAMASQFVSEELAAILAAAEESAARIVERARESTERQLEESNRLWREVQTEVARFGSWRDQVAPVVRTVRSRMEEVRARIDEVPERIRGALADMAEAMSALSTDLGELEEAGTPPTLVTPRDMPAERESGQAWLSRAAETGPDDTRSEVPPAEEGPNF